MVVEVDRAYLWRAVIRKALLLLVVVETAAMAILASLRWGTSYSSRLLWLVAAAWVVFIVLAALVSYNWRREQAEDDEARGFEVLPRERDDDAT